MTAAQIAKGLDPRPVPSKSSVDPLGPRFRAYLDARNREHETEYYVWLRHRDVVALARGQVTGLTRKFARMMLKPL